MTARDCIWMVKTNLWTWCYAGNNMQQPLIVAAMACNDWAEKTPVGTYNPVLEEGKPPAIFDEIKVSNGDFKDWLSVRPEIVVAAAVELGNADAKLQKADIIDC